MTYDVIDRARHRTRRWIAVVTLAAAAATALGVAAVTALRDEPTTAAQQTDVTDAAPVTDSAPVPDAAARAVALPADLKWTPVAGISLPGSGQAGPLDTGGGAARRFSHDEAGALLAAVHITVRCAPQLGPGVFDQTLQAQVVGADAPAMRSKVGQDYDHLRANAEIPYGQPVGRLEAVLRGYQLTSYSQQAASVQLLTEARDAQGNPLLAATAVQVQWTGTDWALLAPAGGDLSTAVSRAGSPDGFHPFIPGR
ncbi:hypothetical protein KBX06_26820 [Micromonospora sp. C31]|uniref:hypothetical protein n=1 Tax=Micromonospora sp. C31 TaxID=2824876 RepID=UPI001B36BA23|nr:hypothetical protein [Micromonospora sp. C31]MBQ1076735.1 hypothetical protein [Micromonospora sp. C31]